MTQTLGNLVFIPRAAVPSVLVPGVAYPSVTDRTPAVYQAPTYQVTVIPG